jgi:hypothetical protein
VVGESCAGSNQQKAFAHLSSPSLLLLLHLFCLFLSPPYGLAPLDIQRRRAQQDKRGICSLAGAQEKIREFEKPPPFIDHAVVNQPCSFLNTLLLSANHRLLELEVSRLLACDGDGSWVNGWMDLGRRTGLH